MSTVYKSPQWLMPTVANVGKVSNYSFEFDGVDDYINTGDSTLSGETAVSVSAWVYPTSYGGAAAESIISTEQSSPNRGFYLALYNNQNFRWQISTNGIAKDSLDTAGSTVTLNAWQHVLAVWTQSTMSLYINGVLSKTQSTSNATGTFTTTNDLLLGARLTSAGFFEGNIDEVAIWNSDQSSNVATIYNSGTPTTLPVTPIAHWKMGEEANFTDNWLVNNSALSNYSTRSFNFDGVDDFINCGNITALNNAPNASWSFWMNPSATALRYLFSAYQGSGSNQQIYFAKKGTGVQIRLRGQGYVGGTPVMFNESSQSWTLGSWYHIVVTFDGAESDNAQKVKVYVNGSALTNTSAGAAFTNLNTTTSDFHIASFNSSNEFAGNIDEFAIFNTTLSASDVTTIYGGGTPSAISSLSPISHWRMGEDATFSTNWSLPDNGSASNTGTSANMTIADLEGNAPNYTGGGLSANMSIEDRVGDAPNSTSNAVSFNMTESDRETDVPS